MQTKCSLAKKSHLREILWNKCRRIFIDKIRKCRSKLYWRKSLRLEVLSKKMSYRQFNLVNLGALDNDIFQIWYFFFFKCTKRKCCQVETIPAKRGSLILNLMGMTHYQATCWAQVFDERWESFLQREAVHFHKHKELQKIKKSKR